MVNISNEYPHIFDHLMVELVQGRFSPLSNQTTALNQGEMYDSRTFNS